MRNLVKKRIFFDWLRVSYCSYRINTGKEKSYTRITMNECGYSSILDFTPDIQEISDKYLNKTPKITFETYNAEFFIKYISKFSDEDKVLMLFEVAKFIGEDNLKEVLEQCKALSEHCRIHELTKRLNNILEQAAKLN